MKPLKFSLLPLAMVAAMGLAAQSQPDHTHQNPEVKDQMVLSGQVKRVLTGESLVWIHNDHGAEVEVAMSTLGPLSGGQIGLQRLEPGMDIDARMHPGVLGTEPASHGRVWITVDGKKFARVLPDAIDEHLFDDDSVTVRFPDGCEEDVSLADLLREQTRNLEPIR